MRASTALERFSRYVLYEKFFEHILRRERTKLARQGIEGENRLRFVRAVAWLGWIGDESRSITTRTLRRALSTIDVQTRGDRLREFVIGSVLERKPPDLYYFAHRSFHEFLSAQYLLNASITTALLSEIAGHVNEEILTFVQESGRADGFRSSVLDVLASYSGSVSLDLLSFLAGSGSNQSGRSGDLASAGRATGAGPVLVHVLSLGEFPLEGIERQIARAIAPMRDTPAKLALLVGLCLRVRHVADDETLSTVSASLVGLMHSAAIDVMERRCQGGGGTAASDTGELVWARLLVGSITARFDRNELKTLELDLGVLEELAIAALGEWLQVREVEPPEKRTGVVSRLDTIQVLRLAASSFDSFGEEERARRNELRVVEGFWRSNPSPDDFVSTSTSTRPVRATNRASRLSLRRPNS